MIREAVVVETLRLASVDSGRDAAIFEVAAEVASLAEIEATVLSSKAVEEKTEEAAEELTSVAKEVEISLVEVVPDLL